MLPEAELEFVILADTHDIPPEIDEPGAVMSEFASRAQQHERVRGLSELFAGLDTPLSFHLGDLVQSYPGEPSHREALETAVSDLRAALPGLAVVAGNHDVGDKADPSSPAPIVADEFLETYREIVGPDWQAIESGPCVFILLNSSLFNSSLPAAVQQDDWVRETLEKLAGRRLVVLTHYPVFLADSELPGVGVYDVVAEPHRSKLIQLFRSHAVELVVSGHTHFAFLDRIGSTKYLVATSTTFTRPGFAELFAAEAPPERGRDDRPKLGFYIGRVRQTSIDIHFVRTEGRTQEALRAMGGDLLLTRLPGDLESSPLGINLVSPITNVAAAPAAWPSITRQWIKNDYPAMAIFEAGVRHLRFPGVDLNQPWLREQLHVLRDTGVSLTASWLTNGRELESVPGTSGGCDTAEIILSDAAFHLGMLRRWVEALRESGAESVSLSLVEAMPAAGTQHPRSAVGFRPESLVKLRDTLRRAEIAVDRVLCRLLPSDDVWNLPFDRMSEGAPWRAVDWIVDLGADDELAVRRVLEALFAYAVGPGQNRLFVEPLIALDRSMDQRAGVLDRLCNPTPVMHALRSANTLLFRDGLQLRPADAERHTGLVGVENGLRSFWLLTSAGSRQTFTTESEGASVRVIDAARAEITGSTFEHGRFSVSPVRDGSPLLVEGPGDMRPADTK